MARIGTKEELRRIIAEPRPATRVKILDALDEQSIEFLKRCPFALVGTTSADGNAAKRGEKSRARKGILTCA